MRLTLVISSLDCGGAERVMSVMANYWAAKAWKVTLLTMDDGSSPPFYDIDPRIRHIHLGVEGNSPNVIAGLRNNFKRIRMLRRAVRYSSPDAIISFLHRTNVITLLATRGLNVPVIVSERIDPTMNHMGRLWEQLRLKTYPFADLLVVQSRGAMNYFAPKFWARTQIIPNPVPEPPPDQFTPDLTLRERLVVAMGRFDRQKGFDILLHSFGRLKDEFCGWTLMILGEGPLRSELETLRCRLGLADRVLLPGRVKNPYEVLKRADLFVMPSRFEGFPNALCEAMACGLPVICTDCQSGPREIIRDGVNGILVPNEDTDALTAAMRWLMRDEVERRRLATAALTVTEQYATPKVMQMWEEAVDKVTAQQSVKRDAKFASIVKKNRKSSPTTPAP